jgi:hypothetical protein
MFESSTKNADSQLVHCNVLMLPKGIPSGVLFFLPKGFDLLKI